MQIAPGALLFSLSLSISLALSLWETAGVRETTMATATIILQGGAGAMVVSGAALSPSCSANEQAGRDKRLRE